MKWNELHILVQPVSFDSGLSLSNATKLLCFWDGDPGKELLVSIHAGDRGGDQAVPFATVFCSHEMADSFDGLLMERGISDEVPVETATGGVHVVGVVLHLVAASIRKVEPWIRWL